LAAPVAVGEATAEERAGDDVGVSTSSTRFPVRLLAQAIHTFIH